MQVAEIKARCPYKVGDKLVLVDHTLAEITDIMITYSFIRNKSEFRYELDHSGQYVRFMFDARCNHD